MLNKKKALLMLLTIFVLVGLQATFAANTTDSQIHDTTDSNIITTSSAHTITQSQTTDNSNKMQEQITTDDGSTSNQSTNEVTKTSKNNKMADESTNNILSDDNEPVSRIYGFDDNKTFYKSDNYYEFHLYVCDENDNDFYTGLISLQVDDGNSIEYEPYDWVSISLEDLSYGEHTVYLSYSDEDNVHPSNQTSFKFTRSEIEWVNLHSTYYSSSYDKIVYTSEESENMNVYLTTNNYDDDLVHNGILTLSIYNDTLQDYSVIKTIHDTDDEFNQYLENGYFDMISMPTLLSYYTTEEYPITVQYRLNYTDLSGEYMNVTYDTSINVFKASDYILEIENTSCKYGEEVVIPIVIKDSIGEIVTPEFTFYAVTDEWNDDISYTRNGDNVILSTYSFEGGKINWAIQFTDGSIAKTTSNVNVYPNTYFSSAHDMTVYKGQDEISIGCTVYVEYPYDSYYVCGNGKKVTVKLDDELLETIYLEDESDYYSTIDVNALSVGEHIITLSFEDETGEYQAFEKSYKLTKLDMAHTVMTSSKAMDYVLNTDESIEINFRVYDDLNGEDVDSGNVTFALSIDENTIPVKTVDVTEGKIIVEIDSILSKYADVSYPLYVDVRLIYNDTDEQYMNNTIWDSFTIYEASKNTVEIPDMAGSIPYSITIPVTVKDEDGNIISSDDYNIFITTSHSPLMIAKDGSNVIVDTYDVYIGNYTITWGVRFNDGTLATTNSTLTLNPSMSPSGNRTIYKNEEEIGLYIEVYSYVEHSYIYVTIPGDITIKLDDEIYDQIQYSNGEYAYYMDVSGLSIGEHTLQFLFEDENGTNQCNSTLLLNKINMVDAYISSSLTSELLNTEDTFSINFNVRDRITAEEINEGNVTLLIYDFSNGVYVPIQTVGAAEKTFTVNMQDIIQYAREEDYSRYEIVYNLNYTDLSGQYTNNTRSEIFYVHNISKNTIEVPEAEGYLEEYVDVPIILKDKDGNIIDSDIISNQAYNRLTLTCQETGNSISIDDLNGLYISSSTFDGEGSYTLEWRVLFYDDTVAYTTSTLTIIPKPKESRLPSFADTIVYKNQDSWYIWVHVSDENDDSIYYGTITVLLDGVIVDTGSLDGNYEVYCSIDLADVSLGEHTVTITYTDENGEHPDNTTSFTLTKKDTLTVDMSITIQDHMIMVTDENVELSFTVYDADTYESVQVGRVTFFLYSGGYVLLNSVDVTDGKIIVDIDSILSYYSDVEYPLTVEAGLMYKDTTEQYQNITCWNDFNIHDKIPVTITYDGISENITDEKTTFDLMVKDYDGNLVPNGKVNILGYIEDVEFSAEATVIDGIATITITEPNFNDYMGSEYYFTAYYTDDNNVYENAQNTFYDKVLESLILEINDTTIPRGEWTTIYYVIKDKNGEIIYPYIDSYSFSSDKGYFGYSLYEESNRLDLYSDSEVGEYIISLQLYTDENSEAITTFKVTLKDVQGTHLEYLGYDVSDDSTTFNFKVTSYDDTIDEWTGLVDQGTVNVSLTIDDTTYTGVATVEGSVAYVTVDGLNLQNYIGQDCQINAIYHDDAVDYYDASYSTSMTVKEKLTLLVNDTVIPRNRWTYIPVTLLNSNGEEVTPNGYVNIYSSHPNVSQDDNYNYQLGVYYSGDELGEYDYTLRFYDYDDIYEIAYTDVTFTYKDSIDTYPRYLGYDYDSDSTTFNFTVVDKNDANVPKGTLTIAFDLYDDGIIDYEDLVDVTDGKATYTINNFKITNYLGSVYRIYYNYTDVDKDYLDNNTDYYGQITDVVYLTVENQTGITRGSIYTPFTLTDKNGDNVQADGYFIINTIGGIGVCTCNSGDIEDGKIYINLANLYDSGEILLTAQYYSSDENVQSNSYIFKVTLYSNSSLEITSDELVYVKQYDIISYMDLQIIDYSKNMGKVLVYLDDESEAIECDVESDSYELWTNININELRNQLKDVAAGIHELHVKYVSDSEYVNSSSVTTQITVSGNSSITTDQTEYTYIPNQDENIGVTITDESNSNGTVIIYLIDENDVETPIMAYYNMQSGAISIDSIGKLLESKYGYNVGDTANLELKYDSDFKYVDNSYYEIQITFAEESTLTPTHVDINASEAQVNEAFNITVNVIDEATNEAIANAQVTVTIGDETLSQETNENGELVISHTPTESGLLNVSVSFDGNNQYDSSANTLVVLVKEASQDEYIKELEDKISEYEELIGQLNDTVNNQSQVISQLNDSNHQLQEQLDDATSQIDNLEQSVENLTNANNNLTNQLNNTQSELTNAQNTIAQQNSTIQNLEKQVNNQTQQINDLNDKIEQANANNTQLAEQLAQLNNTKNNLERQLNNTQQQLTQAQNNITSLEKQLKDLKDNNTKLVNQINNLTNEKQQLQNQLNEAKANLTTAQNKIAQQDKTIKDLEKQLNDTQNNNTQLQQQLNQAKQNNTQLQKDLKDSQDKVKNLENQIKNQTTQINNLEKQLNDSNKVIDNQNKTIQNQNNQIKTLNNTVKDLNNKLNNATKQINDLNNKLASKDAQIKNLTEQIKNLTTIKQTTLTLTPINASVGSQVTLEAKIVDENNQNVEKGYVIYKINGQSIKDADGNLLYATVANGVAKLKYTVPKSWFGKNLTLSAVYKENNLYNSSKADTKNITITAGKVVLKIANQSSHENGENTQFVVTVLDEKGNNIKDGQVLIKINGVTLKDANGKAIIAKVTNGIAIVDYKVFLSTKVHNITAVYTNKGYERTEVKTTLNITKGEAFIRASPIITKTNSTQITATIVDKNKENIQSDVVVALKLNGKSAGVVTAKAGVINTTIDTSFKAGSYLLEIIIGETGKYKSDRVTTTIIKS